MAVGKIILLSLLCAIDLVIGACLAWVLGSVALVEGMARTTTTDNAAYMLFTFCTSSVPLLVWLLRKRASDTTLFVLAALPIALFFALGGRLWVRFG